MLDILASYLSESATVELKDSLEQALAAFERIELPDYEGGYEKLLVSDDVVDRGITLQAIVALTRELQDAVLTEHGIALSSDSELDMRTKFIEALLDLPDYEDTLTVARTLSLDVSNEEIMAELCELVTSHNASEWMPVISEVSGALIMRLRTLIAPLVPVEQGSGMTHALRSQRLDALVRLGKHLHSPRFAVTDLIAEGSDIGFPFAIYAASLGAGLEAMGADKAAQELLAMCLASYDGFDSPIITVKQNLETFVSDPDMATKIMVKINQLVLQMQATPDVVKVSR